MKKDKHEKKLVGELKKKEWAVWNPCLVPISIRKGLVVNLVVRLIINLVSRFWGLDGAYESNHFLEQTRRRMMTTTPNINMHQNNEGEKTKGGRVLWWVFFSFYIFVKPINFSITKNLVIIYKLNTIKKKFPQRKRFCHGLGLLDFCHILKEITKEKKNQNQKVRCTCEHVNT